MLLNACEIPVYVNPPWGLIGPYVCSEPELILLKMQTKVFLYVINAIENFLPYHFRLFKMALLLKICIHVHSPLYCVFSQGSGLFFVGTDNEGGTYK